jgi:DNA-binding transcriptional LysR family regulator
VELRQLRYLVAIAEQQHLGRAARGLYLSQPALSYALKELEAELGVRLFDRHAGGMRVTAAGEDVVAEARETLRQAERVLEAANRHLRAATGVLRVGFEASGAGELTTRSRAAFSRRHPAVRVEPKRFEWGGEAAALREGRADVAFVWLPNDLTGLVAEVVHTEPRVVGLPAGHRLLAGGAPPAGLSLRDVNDEPLMWTERAPREWVDWWAVNPRPDGSEPRWGPTNDNVEEMLEQVAEGVAVCFAPQSMARYYARPGIVWLPLTDAEPLRVALAWPKGADTPLVRAFAEAVRQARDGLARPAEDAA